MKRILPLLLCFCLLLPLTVACSEEPEAPAQNTHTHTASVGYANDDSHHWNPCTVEGCNIKMGWEEHRFADGIVTTLPTEETDGEMTYTCVCGQTKTEPVSVDSANDLIFDAAALGEKLSNVCVRVIATKGDTTVTELTVCFDGDLMSVSGKLEGQTINETVGDASRIEAYRSALFFVRQFTAQSLRYDADTKMYVVDSEATVSGGNGVAWSFANVGLKLSKNLISYVSCDYHVWDTTVIDFSGRLELMLYDYGEVALQ